MRLTMFLVLALAASIAAAEPYGFLTAERAEVKTTFGMSESDTPLILGGGYRFNRHLAVEGSTFIVDNMISRDSTPASGGAFISTAFNFSAKGVGLFALGSVEPAQSLSLFARGGLYLLGTEARVRTSSVSSAGVETQLSDTTTKDSVTLPALAVGAAYAIDKHFSVRALLEHIAGDGPIDRITAAGVSLVLSF